MNTICSESLSFPSLSKCSNKLIIYITQDNRFHELIITENIYKVNINRTKKKLPL